MRLGCAKLQRVTAIMAVSQGKRKLRLPYARDHDTIESVVKGAKEDVAAMHAVNAAHLGRVY
jgi:hypothetical protein